MEILSENRPRTFDPALLRKRVAETASWCSARADVNDPHMSLRQLPDPLRGSFGVLQTTPNRVVYEVIRAREQQLGAALPLDTEVLDGRLLVYFPDTDLADGAAEVETNGFFDSSNTPPWDCWVALIQDDERNRDEQTFLIAYVPAPLEALVDRGIEVNPERCIAWLDEPHRQKLGLA